MMNRHSLWGMNERIETCRKAKNKRLPIVISGRVGVEEGAGFGEGEKVFFSSLDTLGTTSRDKRMRPDSRKRKKIAKRKASGRILGSRFVK